MVSTRIEVLGTMYDVDFVGLKDQDIDGYCDYTSKRIVVRSDNKNEVENFEWLQKKQLRHEIVHAFLAECGLQSNFEHVNKWGHEETMVDWIAIMFPKLHEAFCAANAL